MTWPYRLRYPHHDERCPVQHLGSELIRRGLASSAFAERLLPKLRRAWFIGHLLLRSAPRRGRGTWRTSSWRMLTAQDRPHRNCIICVALVSAAKK